MEPWFRDHWTNFLLLGVLGVLCTLGRSWAAAGAVANLSEVVSGKQWEETSILIQTAAPELSPFVVLWVSLFQHSAAPLCKFKQLAQRWSHQIYWNQWFGSLNLLVVPDVETIGWSGAGCALDHCSPAFWAASDTYGFVWKLGRKFQNNTCFIACPCSWKTKIVRLPQPMSWDNSHGRQQEKVANAVVELLPVSIALHRNKFRFAQSYSRGMARYGIVSMPQCHVYISYNYIYIYVHIYHIYIYTYNIYV